VGKLRKTGENEKTIIAKNCLINLSAGTIFYKKYESRSNLSNAMNVV